MTTVPVCWGLARQNCRSLTEFCTGRHRIDIIEERGPVLIIGGRLWRQLHFSGGVDHTGFRASATLLDVAHVLGQLIQHSYLNAVVHLVPPLGVELTSFTDLYLLLEVGDMGAVIVPQRAEVSLHGVKVPVGKIHAAKLTPDFAVGSHRKAVYAACAELLHRGSCLLSLAISHSFVFHF